MLTFRDLITLLLLMTVLVFAGCSPGGGGGGDGGREDPTPNDTPTKPSATFVQRDLEHEDKHPVIKWKDESDNETGFEIQRAPNPPEGDEETSLQWAELTTIDTSEDPATQEERSFIDGGASESAGYHYRVRALGKDGKHSEWDDSVQVGPAD